MEMINNFSAISPTFIQSIFKGHLNISTNNNKLTIKAYSYDNNNEKNIELVTYVDKILLQHPEAILYVDDELQ